ncbi:MAG: hypothetical protein L3J21_07680 [Devosiaceae bacterium]|nr:hypothetical protein [Devosiaceae bacterium]
METELINSVQENSGNIWVIVSTIAAAFAAIFSAVAVAISFWQDREFRKQIKAETYRKKMESAFNLNPLHSESYLESTSFLQNMVAESDGFFVGKSLSVEDVERLLSEPKAHTHLINTVNCWRLFCDAYYADILDKNTALTTTNVGFINYMEQWWEYIEKHLDLRTKPPMVCFRDELLSLMKRN